MDLTPDEAAEVILIAHQRQDYKGCVCGWAELGKSHPGHQVAMLREAALIRDALIDERAAQVLWDRLGAALWQSTRAQSDQRICTCPDCDVTAFNDKPAPRTVKGLDPACPVHGGDQPRTVEEAVGDNPEEQRP